MYRPITMLMRLLLAIDMNMVVIKIVEVDPNLPSLQNLPNPPSLPSTKLDQKLQNPNLDPNPNLNHLGMRNGSHPDQGPWDENPKGGPNLRLVQDLDLRQEHTRRKTLLI